MGFPAACVATLLLFVTSSAAAETLVSVRGDLDYVLSADIHGAVTSTGAGVLNARTLAGQPAASRGLALTAQSIHATLARTTAANDSTVPVMPTLVASGRSTPPSNQILTNDEPWVEDRDYPATVVTLLESTELWNVVAYAVPAFSDSVRFQLPEGAYALANSRSYEEVVSSAVPRPTALLKEMEPALQGAAGRLQFSAPSLDAQVDGDFYLLLYGGTFQLQTPNVVERLVTGRYQETRNSGPLGLPQTAEYNQTVLLRVHGGSLHLSDGDRGLTLYAPEADIRGSLRFAQTSADLAWRDAPTQASRGPLGLSGDLHVAPRGAAYRAPDGAVRGPLHLEGLAYVPTSVSPLSMTLGAAGLGLLGLAAALRWIPGAGRWGFGLVASFSMVGREDALDQASRQQIFDHVRQNPGTTLSDAHHSLRLGWGTTGYHVAVLERLGLIVSKRSGGKRLLFVNGQGRILDPEAVTLLRNPRVRRLTQILLASGTVVTKGSVAAALGCTPQYAGRLLVRLCGLGWIAPAPVASRSLAYVASPMLVDIDRRFGELTPGTFTPIRLAPLPEANAVLAAQT